MGYLKNIHPGKVLKKRFLDPLGIMLCRIARESGLSRTQIEQIIRRERDFTTETAIKIGSFLGTVPKFWMNLQALYNIEVGTKRQKEGRENAALAALAEKRMSTLPDRSKLLSHTEVWTIREANKRK